MTSAKDYFPEKNTLKAFRSAAEHCHGCHLYKNAIQTVFGEGKKNARVMMVGEIAGKKEDEEGRPFVGPAGLLLRNTMETAGIGYEDVYFTNVVKHFKFDVIKHRKMHRSPGAVEIKACKPWLEAEIDLIQPKLIVCLGAIAAKTLMSKDFQITKQRGRWFDFSEHTKIMATFHPSAILRSLATDVERDKKKIFIRDIKKITLEIKKISHTRAQA